MTPFPDYPKVTPLPDNPKDALETYIKIQLPKYLDWYAKVSTGNWVACSIIETASIAFGLLAAICAALSKQSPFLNLGWWQILMVVFPLLGSLCATFLIQSRIREFHALRERGRIEVEDLIQRGRSAFASAKTPAEYTEIHNNLLSLIKQLETAQSKSYFTISARSKKASKITDLKQPPAP